MSAPETHSDTPLIRILHPSDFSHSSAVAFAHALKLALESRAELEIMHVTPHLAADETDVHWTDFPGVRSTLAAWGVLPLNAHREDVAKAGLFVKKIVNSGADPLAAILRYCEERPPDLIVLATHQRDGLTRWLHKAVAEPLARKSHTMTLFVPQDGKGFISMDDGAVTLRRILIPVDHQPIAQGALEEVYFLASGLECKNMELRLLHVGTEGKMPTLYLPHRPGWTWEERMVPGNVVDGILQVEAEWSPDLIVLATQGHLDFLDALRGSTTERVLRGAHCPVLAVPAI